jgi:ring-1,2-phenylacetyl-CoA epoxidase subunit PaaB
MPDTQWPNYEVFQQERAGQPHRNVGSVHAPDAEMALQNAKDVFVRRPNCLSLWVVPSDVILAKSSQELAQATWAEASPDSSRPSAEPEPYYVCQKQSQKPSDAYVVHVGEVVAAGPVEALRRGLAQFGQDSAWVWWVFPARAVTRSERKDIESMFEPALKKHYRHQYHYHTVAGMRKLKKGQSGKLDER